MKYIVTYNKSLDTLLQQSLLIFILINFLNEPVY